MQQFLKATAGMARAQVVATEFLDQRLVAIDHSLAALDADFGREALSTLAHALETGTLWFSDSFS